MDPCFGAPLCSQHDGIANDSSSACQIARTCAIFNVDEIVVFDEGENPNEAAASGLRNMSWKGKGTEDGDDSAGEGGFDTGSFLARILQYLETPQ